MQPKVQADVCTFLLAADFCRRKGISEQALYRWRQKYGGLDLDEAKRLKGHAPRVKAVLDTQRAHLTVYGQGRLFKRWPYPFVTQSPTHVYQSLSAATPVHVNDARSVSVPFDIRE